MPEEGVSQKVVQPIKKEASDVIDTAGSWELGKSTETENSNRFILEREPFNEGGWGFIFKGYDKETGNAVAVKIVDPAFARSEKSTMAEIEGRVMQQIDHPAAVKIIDIFRENLAPAYGTGDPDSYFYSRVLLAQQTELPIIVMEYIDGFDLGEVVYERNVDVKDALQIIGKLADLLDYLDQRGIYHRDIKAANIMVSKDFRDIRLVDFGMCNKVMPLDKKELPVSPYSSSPESQDPAQIGLRSEEFSLAVVAYQVLCGQMPYGTREIKKDGFSEYYSVPYLWQSYGLTETPYESLSEKPIAVENIPPEKITNLDAVFKKALAMNPHDRYSTASEFALALKEAMK